VENQIWPQQFFPRPSRTHPTPFSFSPQPSSGGEREFHSVVKYDTDGLGVRGWMGMGRVWRFGNKGAFLGSHRKAIRWLWGEFGENRGWGGLTGDWGSLNYFAFPL